MYKILERGKEYETFGTKMVDSMFSTVAEQIKELLLNTKDPKPAIMGGFALKDVPMIDGNKTNVWIEYNAKLLPMGLVDAGIHECIMYDTIPDIVLDRYNDIKELVFKNK